MGQSRFARPALEVCEALLPAWRTKFSKRQFTQLRLLPALCMMRHDDGTFREAEVPLGEHTELWSALKLSPVPDYVTLYRLLTGLRADIDPHVSESIVMSSWG
jgi:hypothetical protein